MLSIRDLDTLPKFAPLLCVLLFTTALMVHLELLDEQYMPSAQGVVQALDDSVLADWALNNESDTIQIIGWGIVLAGLLCFTLMCMWIVRMFLCEIQSHVGYYFEFYLQAHLLFIEIVALICMMGGFLFVIRLLTGLPISVGNPFWYFGLICYGFFLIEIGAVMHNPKLCMACSPIRN